MRQIVFISMLWITIIFMTACSHHDSLQSFNKYYYGGNDEKAYKYAKDKAGKSGDVLWNLQAGVSAFTSHQEDTLNLLEQGETLFSKYESEGLMGRIFGSVGSVLVNENIRDYRGNIYEGVMFNYYKALNTMSQKDYARARVEFNRANDRQRRAKDYFNKDIQKALAQEHKQNAQDRNLQQVDTHSSISSLLQKEYSNLKNFQAYEGFINPAVSYVSALFFMLEEDYNKAMDLYKESYGINHASIINQDLQIMQKRKNSNTDARYTWFIIEDGQSAHKQDMSINLPTFYVSNNVLHVGVAIPMLVEGKISARIYQAQSTEQQNFKASEVADLDKVIANEFNKQLPFILTRTISSAILKSITQNVLDNQFGTIGALAGALYSMSTTNADVRIATALPKRVLVLQIPNNVGKFMLQADNRPLYNVHFECIKETSLQKNMQKIKNIITLCEKNDNILYLRVKGNNPTYRILKGGNIDE